MRKVFCLFIGLLFVFSTAANAQMLIVEDLDTAYRSCISKYDSTITVENLWYNWRFPMLERFQSGEIPDIVTVRSYNDDLPALIEAGMLTDISVSSVIQNDIAGMYDCIKKLVIQPDSSIYGVPGFFCLDNDTFVPSAWQRAGLDYNDRPTSFTGLLDLAEWWLESGGARNDICFLRLIEDECSHPYINWFLDTLVRNIQAQSSHQGVAPVFSEPDVIALVERCIRLGNQLEKAEPSAIEKQEMGCLIYGHRTNGYALSLDQPVTMDDLIPFALTNDDPPLYWGNLDMVCMTAGSTWGEEGIRLLELYPSCRTADYQLLRLFPDCDFSAYNQMVDPMNGYSKAYLESLRTFSGEIVLPVDRITYMDTYQSERVRLIKGEITAEQFCRWLDDKGYTVYEE